MRALPRALGAPLRISATGPRAVPDVWHDYSTPARWSTWAPQITRVDYATGTLVPGARGVVRGPVGIRVPFIIDAADPELLIWSWRPGWGRIRVRMRHGVDVVPDGSRAWVEILLPRLVAAPYAPLAGWALRRLVAR